MKKFLILALAMCLIFASCSEIEDASRQVSSQTGTIQTGVKQQESTVSTGVNKDITKISYTGDASVEILVQMGEDFLFAAFGNDTDSMSNLCSGAFSQKILQNPKLYIGTKPDYGIDKIDMTIKPLESAGKYSLQADVSAVKREDKKKYIYKYSFNIDKVNGDYFITDFKRIY